MDVKTTSMLKFLDKEIELPLKDRTNPTFLMFLAQIEYIELYHGDGLLWYSHLKEKYGLCFGSKKLETKIENILISNKKRGIRNTSEK